MMACQLLELSRRAARFNYTFSIYRSLIDINYVLIDINKHQSSTFCVDEQFEII